MATRITIDENVNIGNVDINYVGDISYKDKAQSFNSGESFNNKVVSENPISYSIAKDVFSIITENKYYGDVFNNIRDEKQGVFSKNGGEQSSIDALAQNDFVDYESLLAVAENETTDFIIGIDSGEEITLESGEDNSNLVVYSFSSKVSYNDNSYYWFYPNIEVLVAMISYSVWQKV